jgi:hypothetical protein
MTFRQRARLIAIAAMGAAVVLGWVVARITNHAFFAVLFVEGVFVFIAGLILQLVGRLQSRRKERFR